MPPAPHTATRATRSRFSSPLHSGVADAAAGSGSSIGRQVGSGSTPTSSTTAGSSNNGVTNAQRAMMARWLEPPVQSKSSFEEAGFQRHGVFEGMAPLGTLPKAVNVAKRISGLPEEKLFHEGSPLGRQTVKQQQKRKEQQGQQGRRAGQQGPDDDDDGEARRELPTVETDTQEQDSTGTQHQEHDEDSKPQERQPISTLNSKKIILKRPNAGKHVPTRIIVAPKRSTRSGPQSATSDVADREDAHQESGPNAPSTPITPTTPSTRRSIIFRPAPGNSKRQARASARQQEKQRRKSQEATDEAADDADQSDQETAGGPDAVLTADVDAGDQVHSNESAEVQSEKPALEKPKSAKRPVGRPKSRRSLAAEQRALKQKEAAEAEAERIVAAEAEAQIEAEAPPVLTPVTTAAPIRPENGQEADTEGDVRDSDGDSVGDSFDSQDEDNDGYGGKPSGFDSSFLPLNTPYGLQRPRSDSNATEVNREVTDKVVDLAVEEAVRHFRYPTAWALRTLYDEQAGNQTFLTMVEDVFQQTADREAINTFARMVHEKKKEGKKDNKGCKHFVPPGTDINIAAHKPIPAPYADLITMDLPQFTTDVSGNIIDSTTDDTAHARKRVKLTDEDSELVVTPPAPATVSMHTFAPPQPSVASDASHRETEQPASASKKSSAKVKTPLQSPRASKTPAALSASATPKTPTKTPRGRPGRPPGSKNKTLAEKAASAQKKQPVPKIEEDATMTTPPPFAQGIDAAPSTPPTIRRHLRADSVASSLSPALSISPPSKNARGLYVDGETISDKDNDVVMRDATGGAVTSIGWTAETVKRTTTKKDGVHESDMAKSRTHEDDSKESSVSQSKRGGGGADRRRGGPGSGRGGRRRGAGRPPKNRTLTGAGLSAPKASTTTQPPEPTPTPAPAPETALQPIATRNRSSAKKSPTPLPALISPLSSSSQPQSQTQTHTTGSQHSHHQQPKRTSAAAAAAAISASAKDEMPAAVEDHISVRPVSVAKRAQNGNGKSRNSTAALPSPAMNSTDAAPNSLGKSESDEAGEERLARLRREARGVTNSIGVAPESFTRGSATLLSTGAASSSRPTSASRSRRGSVPDAASHQPLLETPQPQRQRQLRASTTATRTTRSARKRAFDEVDEDLSPRSGSFPSDDLPSTRLQTPVPAQQVAAVNGSNGNSRAGTPGPKSKKPRVGLRVKSSPVKKKTGTSAGVPRASGERGSPVANGAPSNQDDNDDYCASCSGSGDLVCCDGCTRSFHFNCVDPPVHEDRDLPDEWFCNVCIARRNPASLTRYTGVFGALLNIMEQRNSSAFSLPSETRNYFEGVKTGTEGEYEDIVVTGTSRTRKRNYDEAPDFFRIRDNDGNPVLCHICNSSAQDNRPIIPCAYCGLWWHIDCLDPPMANPPVLRNWRCPAHTDDILAKLPGQLGPAHRFRKIKGAPVVKPSYSRGMINNGFIEFTSDDDSSDSQSGWKHVQTFGRMQRIGARGVELDFLEQIRREQNTGKQRRARMHRYQERPEFRNDDIEVVPKAEPAAEPNRVLLTDRHRIDEAQAAQNLSALYTSEERTDRSGELINALLSQADASVISMMAQGSPLNIEIGSALTQEDLAALQAMRARIDLLLSNPRTRPESHQVNDLKAREADADEAQDVPEVAMEDAQVAGEGLPEPGSEQIVPETNEVMSLVSDNGENEDEDPPTITTPLNASEDEPGSAVWPVEHSVSDPGSGNGTLPASAKAELSENDIDGFRLCDHNNAKRPPAAGDSVPAPILEKTLETVAISNTADGDKEKEDKEDKEDKQGEGQQGADATTNGTSSPPTPVPASSETAVGDEDNKENEKMADRLDKQSEQVDGGLESTEARTETNDAADT